MVRETGGGRDRAGPGVVYRPVNAQPCNSRSRESGGEKEGPYWVQPIAVYWLILPTPPRLDCDPLLLERADVGDDVANVFF